MVESSATKPSPLLGQNLVREMAGAPSRIKDKTCQWADGLPESQKSSLAATTGANVLTLSFLGTHQWWSRVAPAAWAMLESNFSSRLVQ